MKSDYPEIRRCRVCAREDDDNLENIFESNPKLELDLKIAKLLPVVVMPWDPLPHLICKICIDKLNTFNKFYDEATKADKFLRKFIPTSSESEMENIDPIVQINDYIRLFKTNLKVPPKNCPKCSRSFLNQSIINEEIIISDDDVDFVDNKCDENGEVDGDSDDEVFPRNPARNKSSPPQKPEKTLDSFIINPITKTDSIYTCRECFRTYTKQSSALTHFCVALENCGEFEELKRKEETAVEKLPPLKIRLFSTSETGTFVCYLCKKPFEDKTKVVKHLRRHFIFRKPLNSERKSKKNEKNPNKKKRNMKKTLKPGARAKRSKSLPVGNNDNCLIENLNGRKNRIRIWSGPSKKRSKNKTDSSQGVINSVNEEAEDCDEAPKTLSTGRNVESDEKTKYLFSCVFCDKVFVHRVSLVHHQNKHLSNSHAVSSGEHEVAMNKSEKFERNAKNDIFVCRICNMIFTKEKTLHDHERYHFVDLGGVD